MGDSDSEKLKREIEQLRREMAKKQSLLKKMDEQKRRIARENKVTSSKNAKWHQSTSGTGDLSSPDTQNSPKSNLIRSGKINKKFASALKSLNFEDESDVSHYVSEDQSESMVNLDAKDENEVNDKAWQRVSVLQGDKSNPILYIHSYSVDEDQPNPVLAFATVTNTQLNFWFLQFPEGLWENRRIEIYLKNDMEDRIVPLQSSTYYGIAFLSAGDQHSVWTFVVARDSYKLQKTCIFNTDVNFTGESNLYVIDDVTLLIAIKRGTITVPIKISLTKDFKAESTLELASARHKFPSFFPIVGKPQYVGAFSPKRLFIWNHNTGEVIHTISLNGHIGDRVWIATEEEGFIFLMMSDSSKVAHVASIAAVNPSRHESQVFYSMQLSEITDTDTDNPSWIKKMSNQKHILSVLTNSGSIYMWDVLTSKVAMKVQPDCSTRCTFHLNESFNMLVIGYTNGNVNIYL